MSVLKSILMVAALTVSTSAFAGSVDYKTAQDKKNYNTTQTVEGTIVGTFCDKERCFLNFNENYRENLTAVIETKNLPQFAKFKDDAKALGAEIEKTYKTHTVQVKGMVKEWINPKDGKGRPQIVLATAADIKVVK